MECGNSYTPLHSSLVSLEDLRGKSWRYLKKTCVEFVDVLASKSAVPGGGGAVALVGAIRMPLGSMVWT